jgi:hypothetical protein
LSIPKVAQGNGGLAKGVYPFGQVVEVLTVPIPLQQFVERLICTPLFKGFADPQTAGRWMTASSLLVESTNPATADIVIAIPPKHPVYLVDQLRCATPILLIARPLEQLKEVANRECVCPKVSPLLFFGLRQASPHCKFRHQSSGRFNCAVRDHLAVPNTVFPLAHWLAE